MFEGEAVNSAFPSRSIRTSGSNSRTSDALLQPNLSHCRTSRKTIPDTSTLMIVPTDLVGSNVRPVRFLPNDGQTKKLRNLNY
jgi:hypothetical protein